MEGQETMGMIWKGSPTQCKEKCIPMKVAQHWNRASAGSPPWEICSSPLAKTLSNLHYTYLL